MSNICKQCTELEQILVSLKNKVDNNREDMSLLRDLAKTHHDLGDSQGNRYYANYGRKEDALENHLRALEIRKKIVANSRDLKDSLDLSTSYERVGDLLVWSERLEEGLKHHRKSLEIRQQLSTQNSQDAEIRRSQSCSYNRIGDVLMELNNIDEAQEQYRQGMEIAYELMTSSSHAKAIRDYWVNCLNMGDVLLATKKAQQALESYEEGLTLLKTDPNPIAQRDLWASRIKVGSAHRALGNAAGALDEYQQALKIAQKLLADDPLNEQAVSDEKYIQEQIKGSS